KMTVKRLRWGKIFKERLRQSQRSMQKTARPAGIDDESGANRNSFSSSLSFELRALAVERNGFEFRLVEIFHAERLRFANQEMVEVRAVPMRVRDFIARTGGDEQLVAPLRIAAERLSKLMMIKCKTALQSAGDLRIGLLPATPLGQRE